MPDSSSVGPLYDWTFQRGSCSSDVCLPKLDEPLEPGQCFILDISLPRRDLIKWSTSERPEDLACAASAGKGAKAGLLKDLSNEDRKLFDIAKDAELTCWLQASALKPILRKSLTPEQLLKSHGVLSWKPVGAVEGSDGNLQGRKAKLCLATWILA